MDPYERLSNAIIEAAVIEYRKALKIIKVRPHDDLARRDIRQNENFFRSGWFKLLTTIDGEWLIEKLREEVASNGS